MTAAYINRIATAVPPYAAHEVFLGFARSILAEDRRTAGLFERMADKAQIEQRYSCLRPASVPGGPAIDSEGFYRRGRFPGTRERMGKYEACAPALAAEAVGGLGLSQAERSGISHLIVTSCTGFSAPGLDLELAQRCGLGGGIERTVVGFMGCYAALNALKLARHIVRSEPDARVLVVNLELCTLHLQETVNLETVLSFLLFGDGCAASLVTAEPVGIALDRFHAVVAPGTADLITWRIGDAGFDMVLSGRVPAALLDVLRANVGAILNGGDVRDIALWAVHPGGRSVLDAGEQALALDRGALTVSRDVLRRYGNMSSATIMFVLEALLRQGRPGERGCGMAFGPGLTAETMLFHLA